MVQLEQMSSKYPRTEFGNAERMRDLFQNDLKYNEAFGFLGWTGKKWSMGNQIAQRFAHMAVRSIYGEASEFSKRAKEALDDNTSKALSEEAERLGKWARFSETQKMITAMCELVKKYLYISAEEFDTKPLLINYDNGTYDLERLEFREHRREDYLTQCIPFNRNQKAKCPVFLSFYADVMLHRQELMWFMQKAFGLALTGDISEQAWFLLLGGGENGKSTLLDAISYCIGEYATTLSDKTISIAARGGGDGSAPSPDIARLKGKRLVTVSETEDGARLASQLIKRMTGNDAEIARFLHKDPFRFFYTHKLFIYTNNELVVRETGHGFWRRVRRVPFDYTVPAERKDLDLPNKLKLEAEGILEWLLAGAIAWRKEGLGMPDIVAEATAQFRKDQDLFVQWVDDNAVKDTGARTPVSALHKDFQGWQGERSIKLWDARVFNRQLLDHGYKPKKFTKWNGVEGLRLKTTAEKEVDQIISDVVPSEEETVNSFLEILEVDVTDLNL